MAVVEMGVERGFAASEDSFEIAGEYEAERVLGSTYV